MNISFIGFGHLAKAMFKGLSITENDWVRAASPSLTLHTTTLTLQTFNDNACVLPDAEILILAVKPNQMNQVLMEILPLLPPKLLLVSVAAGISLSWFKKTAPNVAVVRAMPNIGAAHARSATPLIANEWVTTHQKAIAEAFFQRLGVTHWVTRENDMDIFTALSGSGPAYVLLLMEAMAHAATQMGIDQDVALTFTLQTAKGALSLASELGASLSELRRQVTSPGGTTAAAINIFSERGFAAIVEEAITAAVIRARELER